MGGPCDTGAMSDQSQGPGWWQANDGKWYPPESAAPMVVASRRKASPNPMILLNVMSEMIRHGP